MPSIAAQGEGSAECVTDADARADADGEARVDGVVDAHAVAAVVLVGRALAVVVAVDDDEHDGTTDRPVVRQPAHGHGIGAPDLAGQ